MLEEPYLEAAVVEPGDGAQPPRDRCPGEPAFFQSTGVALYVSPAGRGAAR